MADSASRAAEGYDPLRNGPTWTGRARWEFTAEPPYPVRVCELQLGDVVTVANVRYQAVPYVIDAKGAAIRNVAALIEADPGCQAVPIGSPVMENLRTGEREFPGPDQVVDRDEEQDGPAPAWSVADSLAWADHLRQDRVRRVEAFGHYVRVIAAGAQQGAVAHLRLAEWQGGETPIWTLPVHSTPYPEASDPRRDIAAHLAVPMRCGGELRDRAGHAALRIAALDGWSRQATDMIGALSRIAREQGDADWAAGLLATAALDVSPHDRGIAREWLAPALQSMSAETRERGIRAVRCLAELSRSCGDDATLDRIVVAMERSAALTDEERRRIVDVVEGRGAVVAEETTERIGHRWAPERDYTAAGEPQGYADRLRALRAQPG